MTDYFLTHLPENLVPYWDFIFEDGSGEPWDSSASAIAVCGILEMCRFLPEAEAAPYLAAAKRLMKALTDLCAVTSPESSNGQLLHGVYGKKLLTTTVSIMVSMNATCGVIISMWKP